MYKYIFLFLSSCFSVYPVSALGQYQSVENEIFTMQRGMINQMMSTLEIDIKSGIRQSGNMVLTSRFASSYATGSVTLTLSKLETTVDRKTGNMESSYVGKLGFDARIMSPEYDLKIDDYKNITKQASGEIRFNILLTQASGDIYVRLDSISANVSSDLITAKDLDTYMKEIEKYKGKTYKIPMQNSENLSLESIVTNIDTVFATLRANPLFSVANKQKDGSYRLRLRADTIEQIDKNMKGINALIFTYRNVDNKKEIRISPRKNARNNYVIVSESDGIYALIGKMYEKTRYDTTDINFSLMKEAISVSIKDRNASMKADWKAGQLLIDYQTIGTQWSPSHTFRVEGRLMPDMTDTDISFRYDGKKIGSLSSQKGDDGVVSFRGNWEFMSEFISLMLDMYGSYSETRGDYTILPPKIYELLD